MGAGSRSTTFDDRGGGATRETQARTVGGQTRTIVVVEGAPLVPPPSPARDLASLSLPPYSYRLCLSCSMSLVLPLLIPCTSPQIRSLSFFFSGSLCARFEPCRVVNPPPPFGPFDSPLRVVAFVLIPRIHFIVLLHSLAFDVAHYMHSPPLEVLPPFERQNLPQRELPQSARRTPSGKG